jgi:hypothetical protein
MLIERYYGENKLPAITFTIYVTADWNNSPSVDIILIHSQPDITFTP